MHDVTIRLSLKDGNVVSAALQSVANQGDQALSRLAQAAGKPTVGMKLLNSAVGEVKNSAIATTTGLGSFGAVLASIGPAGLAAGAGIGAVVYTLHKGLSEFAEAEQASLRLGAVFRATGNSAGVTQGEIEDLADGMEKSTMATAESVKGAAAALATFRSVSGNNFKETIHLAQDMAAVFGGDARSAAVQLGKALEEPELGLTMLRRSGISFSESQREMILEMYRVGDVGQAQALMLAEIRKQLGGSGEGEASGVTGALHQASASFGNLFEDFVRISGIGEATTNTFRMLALSIDAFNKQLNHSHSTTGLIEDKEGALVAARQKLANLQAAQKIGDWDSDYGTRYQYGIRVEQARIDALEKQIDLLKQKKQVEDGVAADKKSAAQQGAIDAELWRNREQIAARQKELDKELVASSQSAADKKRAINEQLVKDIATADKKRDKIGYTDADVDAEIDGLRKIAANKVEAIEKPIRESQLRIREQIAKTIADLDAQAKKASDPRQATIDAAVNKLPKEATEADREAVADRARRVYDLAQAQKELNEALDRETKLREKGKQLTEQLNPVQDGYNSRLRELDELLDAGAIGYDTYAKAAEDAYDKALAASDRWEDGAKRALRNYVRESGNAAEQSEQMMTSALRSGEDAFVKWAQTGEISAKNLFNTIAKEGLRAMYRLSTAQFFGGSSSGGGFLGSLLGGASDWLSGILGGGSSGGDPSAAYYDNYGGFSVDGAHSGAIVGREASFVRDVNPAHFEGASRYHLGGLLPGERPIIAQDGEGIFTPRQMDNADRLIQAAMAGKGARVSVVVNNNAARVAQAQASAGQGPDGEMMVELLIDEVDQRLAKRAVTNSSLAVNAIQHKFGLNPAAGAYRS